MTSPPISTSARRPRPAGSAPARLVLARTRPATDIADDDLLGTPVAVGAGWPSLLQLAARAARLFRWIEARTSLRARDL